MGRIAALYARQSVEKENSISLDSQIEACKREVADGEAYEIFRDEGYSGKNTQRPGFREMLDRITADEISKVVVYKLDRFSRSIVDFAALIETLRKHSVEFISTTEKFDTSTPMGEAMLNITMVFAQLERQTIQKRVTDNYYDRGKMGWFLGGVTPFGFGKERIELGGKRTNTLVERPDQMDAVRYMFSEYAASGASLGSVSKSLNQKNCPAPESGKWDSAKISRILRNPVYVMADADVYRYFKNRGCDVTNDVAEFTGELACFLYGKREANCRKYTDVSGHTLSIALHKGVIPPDVWLACQNKLDGNRQLKNTGRGKHSWLSGQIKCGHCGYTMTVVSADGRYKYFNCRGKTNLKICHMSKAVRVEAVEYVVRSRLLSRLGRMIDCAPAAEVAHCSDNSRIKSEIAGLDMQIENIIENIGLLSPETAKLMDARIVSLTARKETLTDSLQTMQVTAPGKFDCVRSVAEAWDTLSLEQKKAVAREMIDKVRVTRERITIEWRV